MKKNNKIKFGGKFEVIRKQSDILKSYNEENDTWITWSSAFPSTEEIYITRVVYNDPATIVFWNDGTKTVAKAHGNDYYSPDIGLMICCFKKLTSGSALKSLISDWVPDSTEFNQSDSVSRNISDVRKMHKAIDN